MSTSTQRQPLYALVLLALLTLLIAPFIGPSHIPLGEAVSGELTPVNARILFSIRIPRVLLAFIAGAALSVSGMTFQSIFRNVLATPFTLGVASGAALGAALYIYLGAAFSFLWISGISISAFGGAILTITFVYLIARARQDFSSANMLLAGVAISFFFSSLIMVLQYLSDFTQSYQIIRWLMGSLQTASYTNLFNLLPYLVIGFLIMLFYHRELNLLIMSDDIAISRGVAVERTKIILFVSVSLMVGAVVSFCGPIGFIGMMAPHICRLMVGPDHRRLLPASFLFGGILLVVCDTLARTWIAPAEIPVGIITALLGGPFFLWLLIWKSRTLRG